MRGTTSKISVGGLAVLAAAAIAGLTPAPACAAAQTTVINPVTKPVPTKDVDNPAQQPFQYSLSPASSSSNSCMASYIVPAGKRLVIEFYQAQNTQYPSGGYSYQYLITTTGGNQNYYKSVPPVASTQVYNQLTRLYADAGTAVIAEEGQSSGTSCGGVINFSGYFVNVP